MNAAAPTVAIVGGGLAGLAAGCALAESGFRVRLFERRPFLGGRASSYQHPATGEVVDNCQHVLLGCCTNLLDFYQRTGVTDRIRWYDGLTFVEPGGRASQIRPSSLPAPLHSAPSFLAASAMGFGDKLAIARAMLALLRRLPAEDQFFADWLRQHGQTGRAIERFWRVVLVSALNEDLERVSARYAGQVFRESCLKSAEGGRMGVPTVPLTELYAPAGESIIGGGGEVAVRASVESFRANPNNVQLCIGGREEQFDFAVFAVPPDALARVLPENGALRQQAESLETSPITGIHLWFDREITPLDHAVLLDRTIQWMFHKSRILSGRGGEGSYVELVVSSSKALVERARGEIIELAVRELAEFFPAVREARLLKSTVIKEVNATFSILPGADRFRPAAATPWPRVFLAGDWIATGWPATMEGAVRSGYLAAEAVTRAAGAPCTFLVPDLPARGLMRLF